MYEATVKFRMLKSGIPNPKLFRNSKSEVCRATELVVIDLVDGCVVFSCERLRSDDVQDFLEHGNVQHAERGTASWQSRPLEENSALRGRGGGQDRSGRGAAAAAAAAARALLLLVLLVLAVLLLFLAHREHV